MSFLKTKKFQVIALTLGKGMNSVISLAVAMVMARVLSKTDVAAYQQTILAFGTVAPLLGMGIGQGIYYFLPTEEKRPKGLVLDAITALGVAGLIFAVFIALGGNQFLASRFENPRVAEMLLWMIPYSIFTVPASLHAAVLVVQKKAELSAVISVVNGLIVGVCTIVPLLLWQNAETALGGNVVAACMTAVASIILMLKLTPRGNADQPKWSAIKELVVFSFPLGLAVAIGTINKQLDKLIVGFLCSSEEFAVYQFGAKELPLLGMVTASITAVIMADLRKAVKSGDYQKAARQFRICADKSSLLIFPVVGVVLLGADLYVSLIYGADYNGAAAPMRVYSIALIGRVVVYGAFMTALGQNKLILMRSAIALGLNVVISVPMVKWLGPIGAAWATVIVTLFFAVPFCFSAIVNSSGISVVELLPVKKLIQRAVIVAGSVVLLYLMILFFD